MLWEAMSGIYCGPAPAPEGIWLRWNLHPPLLVALALLAAAVGRRPVGALAVAVLAVAFVSPLCALSAALFSARAVHHVLLVAVAAPLLAMAWPARRPPAMAGRAAGRATRQKARVGLAPRLRAAPSCVRLCVAKAVRASR